MKFPIGTKFTPIGKHHAERTIVDIWTTKNSAGDVVRERYVTEHTFCGQLVRDVDVLETTVARSTLSRPS